MCCSVCACARKQWRQTITTVRVRRPLLVQQFVSLWANLSDHVDHVVCLSVLSVLSVCNVGVLWPNGWTDQDKTWHSCMPRPWPKPSLFSAHICCGQRAGWFKMSLGTEVGIGLGDTLLDGDPAPPKRDKAPPIFGLYLLWPNGWMHQGTTWYGGRPRQLYVRWWSSSPQGAQPQFSAHVYCGQTEVDLGPDHIVVDGDPAAPAKVAQQPPSFRPMSIVITVAHLSYCWALVHRIYRMSQKRVVVDGDSKRCQSSLVRYFAKCATILPVLSPPNSALNV